jgi:hypothetical protein
MQLFIHCAILYFLIGVIVLAFICAFVPLALLQRILRPNLIVPLILQTTVFWPLLVWRNLRGGGAPKR